jgi:hypothetical protein
MEMQNCNKKSCEDCQPNEHSPFFKNKIEFVVSKFVVLFLLSRTYSSEIGLSFRDLGIKPFRIYTFKIPEDRGTKPVFNSKKINIVMANFLD